MVNVHSPFSPLSSLTNLNGLSLSGTQVSDIKLLSFLISLVVLGLSNNQISDISSLSSLTNLTEVSLSGNQISAILPLVENSGLGVGDWLCLENNNLDLGEGSKDMEYIGTLKDKGVMVEY